jgi:hypothetical protein
MHKRRLVREIKPYIDKMVHRQNLRACVYRGKCACIVSVALYCVIRKKNTKMTLFSILAACFAVAESTVHWFVVREKHCWMAADSADMLERTRCRLVRSVSTRSPLCPRVAPALH